MRPICLNCEIRPLLVAASVFHVHTFTAAALLLASLCLECIPYDKLVLKRRAWPDELFIKGPDRIENELDMSRYIFLALICALRVVGCQHLQHLYVDEPAAIFLRMYHTGLSIRHFGERLQYENENIAEEDQPCE
jgi:hypothetical protein